MKASWHRISTALVDRESREGSVSVFFDYDLGRWSFGLRFEHDPSWFDLNFDLGPISFSICYWRHYVAANV